MVKKADIPDHVIDTALALAAERGWRAISLTDIAEEAKVPLSKVYPLYPTKQAVLEAFQRRIDAQVLAEPLDEEELEQPARDRLFDVLMRRFDALQPHRDALGNILQDQLRDPLGGLCGLVQLRRSMSWMLEAAGIESGGLAGALRVKGLIAIYLATLRIWLRDDSSDLAKTMAVLDGYLRRVEWLAERLSQGAGSMRDGAGDGQSEPEAPGRS